MKVTINILMEWLEEFEPELVQNISKTVSFIEERDENCVGVQSDVYSETKTEASDNRPVGNYDKYTGEHYGRYTGCCILDRLTDVEMVYITDFRRLKEKAPSPQQDYTFLCTADCRSYVSENNLRGTFIFIKETSQIDVAANLLNRKFTDLLQWEAALNLIIAKNSGLQSMVDVSEPFFHNPFLLITTSLMIPAISHSISCEDPDLLYAMENHTFPTNMISSLIRNRWIIEPGSMNETRYNEKTYHPCPMLIHTFEDNPAQLKAIFLFNMNRAPSSSEYDFMKLFEKKVEEYILEKDIKSSSGVQTELCSQLLISMIDGTSTEEGVAACKTLLSVDDDTHFKLYVIHFHDDIRSQVFYIIRMLSQSFPQVKVFPYQKHIVLMSSHDKSTSRREQIAEFLHEIMTDKNAYCGTVGFDKLTEIPYAYRMACIAAQLGSVINPEEIIHSYREYSIYHYLKSVSEIIPCRMLYANELNFLMAYDRRKQTDNMKLLEIYLDMERATNAVAEKMHLHRNSVSYRINKIQEIIKLDLDDANVRLNLQMSFKMLEMIKLGLVK